MNIGIVGSSPVPFVVGGIENLLWGLQSNFNQSTPHHVELIKLPSPEGSFWELLDSYERFFRLDVSHFDMVLTVKYPGWMIQHPNHVCYMAHRLRGLYDTYHFTGEPTTFHATQPDVKRVLEILEQPGGSNRDAIERLFAALHELRGRAASLPQDYFRFPGPFIRQIIHFLDDRAMSNGSVKRFLAISRTVADRAEYFPAQAPVTVAYPPSFLKKFPQGHYRYLFTASRLDSPKRIGLLIEAMRHVPHDIQLKIAGTGPMEAELRAMAGQDPRIEFLGFVNDDELADYYADALAVPYVPYQEDYGLITLEAMRCAKPVVTCCDSGGPNEFVVDHETGFSVTPNPQALAERLNYLIENPAEAERMGRIAADRVSSITWGSVIEALVPDAVSTPSASLDSVRSRPKIVVTTTFPVYPPQGGGQNRIYYLYKALARDYDIEIVSMAPAGEKAFKGEIAPNLTESRVPKSAAHQQAESEIERKTRIPVTDVAMPRLISMTPAYQETLRRALVDADLVIASHPYMLPVIEAVRGDIPLAYEAHNIEADLKGHVLSGTSIGRELAALTQQVEADACRLSKLIFTCSQEDAYRLEELYGETPAKRFVVPNGVEIASVPFMGPEERAKLQPPGSPPVVLFMGSWHPPNLEAAERIIEYARRVPHVAFILVGSHCMAFEGRRLPRNVALCGLVDDDMKAFLLHKATLAINPMTSGSGSNLKMLDYFAAGTPVLSTEFGARGLAVEAMREYYQAPEAEFPQAIQALLSDPALRSQLAAQARREAEARFDWQVLADILRVELGSLLAQESSLALPS